MKMSEEERRARYQQVKLRRQKHWREMEARKPPGEVSVYGLGSMLGFVVFVVWSMVAPSVFANVATACCIVVWAGAMTVSWRWDER
jgi:hypothetical protein